MAQKIRLNNFVLYCKHWYEPIKKMNRFDEVKKILTLDDYTPKDNNSVLQILLNFIDELEENGIITSKTELLKTRWHYSTIKNMMLFNIDYELALLYTICDFFAYSCDKSDFQLNPPVYNRRLYKLGFVAPKVYGNSYKMANFKTKRFFE